MVNDFKMQIFQLSPIVTHGVGIFFLSHPNDLPVESSCLTSIAYRRPNLLRKPKEPYAKQ